MKKDIQANGNFKSGVVILMPDKIRLEKTRTVTNKER